MYIDTVLMYMYIHDPTDLTGLYMGESILT